MSLFLHMMCVCWYECCSETKAQAACDVRNSRYDRRLQAAVEELAETGAAGSLPTSSSFPDRLNQAEKVAGKFVAKRIRPALQRAREKELPELLFESKEYLKGLWSRLNGTAGRRQRALPPELQLPLSSQKEVDKVSLELCAAAAYVLAFVCTTAPGGGSQSGVCMRGGCAGSAGPIYVQCLSAS